MSEGTSFIEGRLADAETREENLRKALAEQMRTTVSVDHALPIERLMDRLSAGKKLNDEEYALISKEIANIQTRNQNHLSRLENLLDVTVTKAAP